MSQPDRSRKTRAPSFKIELPGDDSVKNRIKTKMNHVKKQISEKSSKPGNLAEVIESALDAWISLNDDASGPKVSSEQYVAKTKTSQEMYLVCHDSIQKLTDLCQDHAKYCPAKLIVKKVTYSGHVGIANLSCRRLVGGKHKIVWATSPKLPDGKYLANLRIQHGLVCSGIRPSVYERLVKAADMGFIKSDKRTKFLRTIAPCIEAEYEQTTEDALHEEIAMYDEYDGIDGFMDARHSGRRCAKDTSVEVLGEKTKKVLCHVHVTKADDPVTQRHELIGVQKSFEYFDNKNVTIKVFTHDMNMSVNAWVRDHRPDVTNQNEWWHGIKGLKKNIDKVSKGARKNSGKTWHPELEDKVEPIGTHAYYAIDTCGGDGDKLKSSLLNCIEHYKGNHEHCSPTSRCRTDDGYIPSRIGITTQKAEQLLKDAIMKSYLYRFADNFVLGRETAHVESFHNTMLMWHDKRSYYSDLEYRVRSHMSVMHWNENVGRDWTSVWNPTVNTAGTRRAKKKKIYKASTYGYRQNVWTRVMDVYYQ